MRGVFLDTDTVDRGDLDLSPIEDLDDIGWSFYGITESKDVLERVEGSEIVVCNKVVMDRETLKQARNIKLIVVAATGTNNIDLAAAKELGVTVCNVRGYSTPAVVQHVYTLILALTTKLPQYIDATENGAWQRHPHFCFFDYPIRELRGLVLGIVGYGALGKGVADIARAFGMRVKVCQRPGGVARPDRTPLHELLPQIDILSLHCPLTNETRGLISEKEIALMKKDAILINTARGGIVDEPALARALANGDLGGAGIDVLTEEPPKHGNVLLDSNIPNLIVTPHIAWATRESRQRVVDIVADIIIGFLRGDPRNIV
ncbi:MAG: 2-hydroxyacid dehydrogenase [Arenicellales bacterium]|nr:2-hydroxyacid dehydrogenase [Arenicellales bacterium]